MMTAEASALAARVNAELLQLLAERLISEDGAMRIFTVLNKEH
jgi:hypothetical protein